MRQRFLVRRASTVLLLWLATTLAVQACGSPSTTASQSPSSPPQVTSTAAQSAQQSPSMATPSAPSASPVPTPSATSQMSPTNTAHVIFTLTIYGAVPANENFELYFNPPGSGQSLYNFCDYYFHPCVGAGKRYSIPFSNVNRSGLQPYAFRRIQNANTAEPKIIVFSQGTIDTDQDGVSASATYTYP